MAPSRVLIVSHGFSDQRCTALMEAVLGHSNRQAWDIRELNDPGRQARDKKGPRKTMFDDVMGQRKSIGMLRDIVFNAVDGDDNGCIISVGCNRGIHRAPVAAWTTGQVLQTLLPGTAVRHIDASYTPSWVLQEKLECACRWMADASGSDIGFFSVYEGYTLDVFAEHIVAEICGLISSIQQQGTLATATGGMQLKAMGSSASGSWGGGGGVGGGGTEGGDTFYEERAGEGAYVEEIKEEDEDDEVGTRTMQRPRNNRRPFRRSSHRPLRRR